MLQIIGWALCAALFCWAVSLFGNANYQVEDAQDRKKMTEAGNMAAVLAIAASSGFGFWLYVQGRMLDRASLYSNSSSATPTDAEVADAARVAGQ